jgi:hypothetical protein
VVEVRAVVGLVGDWDGNGTDTPGLVSGKWFQLRNSSSPGSADLVSKLGDGSGTPIAGDWNGDGIDTIGVVQGNVWYLSNSNTAQGRHHLHVLDRRWHAGRGRLER